VPQSGDAVLFTSAVTLSDETVDVGEAGLTIEAAAEVKSGIVFTGAGKIVKRGAGRYETTHPWKTTGGLRIEGGSMYVNQLSGSEHNSTDPFGTGTIEITDKGYFAHDSWARTFTTPFVIRSLTRANAFSFAASGPATFSGLISSDSDFSIEAGWTSRSSGGPAKFSGGISAPGKTVEFKGGGSQVGGTVNVSIVQNNNAEVYFNGTQTNPENALTVVKGTFMFAPDAVWQGGAVSVASGCKLDIAKGVRVRATNFTVNGEAKPEGRYTAANLPNTITGGGVLRVGGPLGMLLIVR